MKSIIFICLGNICRSPLAEGIAKAKAKELGLNIKIASAGLSHYHNGEAPCMVSQDLAREHGIDISNYISKHFSQFNLHSFNLIIAMDSSNYKELKSMGLKNIKLLGDYGFNSKDVADLYYEPYKRDEVYNMIDIATSKILSTL
jgi:protein-tyrosine phosphatase